MSARIGPGGLRETGPLIWLFSRVAGRVTGTEPPHVFTTLGRGRGLFWGWLHFAGRLVPGGRLARRESELVILRVAHVRGSAYEFAHHRRLARRVGVTSAELARVVADASSPEWSDWGARERAFLDSADALLARRDLTDTEWAALCAVTDEREAIELLLLVGHYDMLATTLTTLRVQPDRER